VVPNIWFAKVNVAGFTVAVVKLVLPAHNAVCQMPRPYVAASKTCAGEDAGGAISCTTGDSGNPLPYEDQQLDDAFAQFATCVVK
jgi:hypothetical protein